MCATALVAVALAVVVLASGPARRTNLTLALFLLLTGVGTFALRTAELLDDLSWVATVMVAGDALALAAIPAYVAFVGHAVASPVARPLRSWPAQGLLLGAVAAVLVAAAIAPTDLFTHIRAGPQGDRRVVFGPSLTVVYPIVAPIVAAFALSAATHAWWRAEKGSVARRRSGSYAIAFGVHDLALAIHAITWLVRQPTGDLSLYAVLFGFVGPGLTLLSFALLAVALLRYQLFDFELKAKWTVRRGALVGAFVLAFFVVASVVEAWFEELGWLAGGVAAGLLVFALRPLERVANGLADRALPGVRATPDYVAYRKLEVYRAAVESALETGGIDARERATLDALARRLGIAQPDARALERDLAAT